MKIKNKIIILMLIILSILFIVNNETYALKSPNDYSDTITFNNDENAEDNVKNDAIVAPFSVAFNKNYYLFCRDHSKKMGGAMGKNSKVQFDLKSTGTLKKETAYLLNYCKEHPIIDEGKPKIQHSLQNMVWYLGPNHINYIVDGIKVKFDQLGLGTTWKSNKWKNYTEEEIKNNIKKSMQIFYDNQMDNAKKNVDLRLRSDGNKPEKTEPLAIYDDKGNVKYETDEKGNIVYETDENGKKKPKVKERIFYKIPDIHVNIGHDDDNAEPDWSQIGGTDKNIYLKVFYKDENGVQKILKTYRGQFENGNQVGVVKASDANTPRMIDESKENKTNPKIYLLAEDVKNIENVYVRVYVTSKIYSGTYGKYEVTDDKNLVQKYKQNGMTKNAIQKIITFDVEETKYLTSKTLKVNLGNSNIDVEKYLYKINDKLVGDGKGPMCDLDPNQDQLKRKLGPRIKNDEIEYDSKYSKDVKYPLVKNGDTVTFAIRYYSTGTEPVKLDEEVEDTASDGLKYKRAWVYNEGKQTNFEDEKVKRTNSSR